MDEQERSEADQPTMKYVHVECYTMIFTLRLPGSSRRIHIADGDPPERQIGLPIDAHGTREAHLIQATVQRQVDPYAFFNIVAASRLFRYRFIQDAYSR
jgi:hypothetical protein